MCTLLSPPWLLLPTKQVGPLSLVRPSSADSLLFRCLASASLPWGACPPTLPHFVILSWEPPSPYLHSLLCFWAFQVVVLTPYLTATSTVAPLSLPSLSATGASAGVSEQTSMWAVSNLEPLSGREHRQQVTAQSDKDCVTSQCLSPELPPSEPQEADKSGSSAEL